jgi:hypothetical protein
MADLPEQPWGGEEVAEDVQGIRHAARLIRSHISLALWKVPPFVSFMCEKLLCAAAPSFISYLQSVYVLQVCWHPVPLNAALGGRHCMRKQVLVPTRHVSLEQCSCVLVSLATTHSFRPPQHRQPVCVATEKWVELSLQPVANANASACMLGMTIKRSSALSSS